MKKKKDLQNIVRRLIKNWVAPVGCGLVFLFLLKFVFFFGYVPSASMGPTIKEGSFIFGVRLVGELKLDDVVVFERDGQLLTKRIAALPGDMVTIGGEAVIVPDGCYYMLGDNADVSIDSRCWDEPFVGRTQVIAVLKYRRCL